MNLRFVFALLLAALAGAVVGCGGGGGQSGSGAAQTGQAQFTVVWPSPAAHSVGQTDPRLISPLSKSVVITLQLGTNTPLSQILTQPLTGNTSTATFANLTPGVYTASAAAHPNVDGTGATQTQATAPLTIVAGQTATLTLTLASTIVSVVVTPNPASILFGQQTQLTATAYDGPNGTGNIVVTSAFTWTSSNPKLASVNATGLVTAADVGTIPPGTVTITATATEPTPSVNGTGAVNVGTAVVITLQ